MYSPPATHSAAATSALPMWVGCVVTQSPVYAITSFWNTPSLNRDSTTRSDCNLIQKCCLVDTLGEQELSINHNMVPNRACY